MGPFRHLLCGGILATGILIKNHDFTKALSCVAGATLCDTDHLLEYAKYCHDYKVEEPSFREWRSGEYFNEKGTVNVLFHSWEACIVMTILSMTLKSNSKFKRVISGLTIGYTSHLVLDQIGNNVNGYSYFWLYRWWNDFSQKSLIR